MFPLMFFQEFLYQFRSELDFLNGTLNELVMVHTFLDNLLCCNGDDDEGNMDYQKLSLPSGSPRLAIPGDLQGFQPHGELSVPDQ